MAEILGFRAGKRLALPLSAGLVPAGFPSPADDYSSERIDLNELLIAHPAATFFVRVQGSSMTGAGIHDGDLLIVDRSVTPRPGSVVVALVDGGFTVKRLIRQGGQTFLVAENPDYSPLLVNDDEGFEVWGVVLHVIHAVR